jgi:hypothetical protein
LGLVHHYDSAHTHPVNRALHLIAIPVGFSSIIVVWFHWIIGLMLIPAALGLATLGHVIEGNRPAFSLQSGSCTGRAGVDDEADLQEAVTSSSQPVGTTTSYVTLLVL